MHQTRRSVIGRALAGIGVMLLARTSVARAAEKTEIGIDNFAFKPNALSVASGTMVSWINRDDIPHSIVIPALQVHSHPLDTDQMFDHRFAAAGMYEYFCGLHPHMKGTVTVT
jgi:plastocyanin